MQRHLSVSYFTLSSCAASGAISWPPCGIATLEFLEGGEEVDDTATSVRTLDSIDTR